MSLLFLGAVFPSRIVRKPQTQRSRFSKRFDAFEEGRIKCLVRCILAERILRPTHVAHTWMDGIGH
jgi:hypothetical protein